MAHTPERGAQCVAFLAGWHERPGAGSVLRRLQVPFPLGQHICALAFQGGALFAWGAFPGAPPLGKNGLQFDCAGACLVPTGVVDVACGYSYALALLGDGTVLAWGENAVGQMGLETDENSRIPKSVPLHTLQGCRVSSLYCGGQHSVAVTEGGDIYVWGNGTEGQLGLGDRTSRQSPTLCTAFIGKKVTTLSCGRNHNAAMLETGETFVWGGNGLGQLGLGDFLTRNDPTLLNTLPKGAKVVCGGWHTAALVAGRIFSWGANDYGQTGTGKYGYNKSSPQESLFASSSPVAHLVCGGNHTIVVLESGDAYGWGWNHHVYLRLLRRC
eukprot:TRINITY_DN2730_c0_g1_i2.p1 TRINITY_DN2730_c0_g1~~TRINITY_DN2730_c0_g1_i2.p1  ORF type:complete len:327 (+),score=16.94 TRINITY_DN2730_c0_g1_i2:53-1033(+)